jgi:hypothetical protein
MMNLKPAWAVVAAASFVVLALGTTSVAAVQRNGGDFWTYDISLGIEGYSVNGTMTYSFTGTDSLTVNGTEYPVNVMRISGGASESIPFFDVEVSAAFGGSVYETRDKMALVKNDLFLWINMSIGSGAFQIVNRTEMELSTTYSPGLLSGFDPAKTAPGDSWSETIAATSTTTEWVDGVMIGSPQTSTDSSSYDITVAEARQTVSTPAGTFDCLKMTAVSIGETVVYYWSDQARNFVKEDSFMSGSSTPFTSMTLRDYKSSSGLAMTTFIAIGGIILVVAIIVLALVVLKKKKSVAPYPPPPQPPPQ